MCEYLFNIKQKTHSYNAFLASFNVKFIQCKMLLGRQKMVVVHRKSSGLIILLVQLPGRQAVTFLMICNLGLWITYNFEIQKVQITN